MRNVLIVALGGAIGSVLRYLLSKVLNENVETVFPIGTFVVNVLGCLLIGLFYSLSDHGIIGANIKLFLTIGLCGGFTTFSTFMNENMQLVRADHIIYMALYAGGSIFLGFLAVYAGMQMGKVI